MKKITNWVFNNRLMLLIIVLAFFIRFYNFENRITFGPEQAISLLVSADYINEKFSLLGLPSTQRTTSMGHIIFYPPVFNYSLIPLLVLLNYNALFITGWFALLNLITGILLYLLVKKIFNKPIALFSSILFLFNSFMVNHSLFIWSVNYLPLLNLFVMFLLAKMYLKKIGAFAPLALGFLVSLSLGVEYIYLFTAIPIFFLTLYFSDSKLKSLLLFLLGATAGILPTILFDITHGFYHFKTLWQYLLDTILSPSQSKITYYHFLHFWPLAAVLGGIILYVFYKKSKLLVYAILLVYIVFNLKSPLVSFNSPVGMYPGLNYGKLVSAAKKISQANPENFNVVMTFDFDSRAHPLRYLLKYNHDLKPNDIENYPQSKQLYVLTTPDYPVLTTSLWEISSFAPQKVQLLKSEDGFNLYKLIK